MSCTRLLLVRHGNTFGPGDEIVWIGARTDLPLVESGRAQAQRLGTRLRDVRAMPALVMAGPLRRTAEHAQLALRAASLSLPVDTIAELREIDYGIWEGKTSATIRASGGATELQQWDEHSIWPDTPGWQPTQAEIMRNIEGLMAHIAQQCPAKLAMVVSSNGILRFFARASSDHHGLASLKVSTGNVCLLVRDGDKWLISYWNRPPEQTEIVS